MAVNASSGAQRSRLRGLASSTADRSELLRIATLASLAPSRTRNLLWMEAWRVVAVASDLASDGVPAVDLRRVRAVRAGAPGTAHTSLMRAPDQKGWRVRCRRLVELARSRRGTTACTSLEDLRDRDERSRGNDDRVELVRLQAHWRSLGGGQKRVA